jgi:hypothetical protein
MQLLLKLTRLKCQGRLNTFDRMFLILYLIIHRTEAMAQFYYSYISDSLLVNSLSLLPLHLGLYLLTSCHIVISSCAVERPKFCRYCLCSQADAGQRVLTPVSGASSRDAPWCPTLDTAPTRKPGITSPTSSRSLLSAMSLSWSCLWCTTGDTLFRLLKDCDCTIYGNLLENHASSSKFSYKRVYL